MTVKSSPEAAYVTQETFSDSKMTRALRHALQEQSGKGSPIQPTELFDTYLAWSDEGNSANKLAVDEQGQVVDLQQKRRLDLPGSLERKLKDRRSKLRSRHYGTLLSWDEIDRKLPRLTKFTVTDLETGLSFQGQRRAGSSHADVQPLTKADSAAMKQIYGGTWSWDRRAVLIRYDGNVFAASMNGMPHGGDGIPRNGFSGHFCIHFLGSTTHGKRNLDLAHQIMVSKAAGQLNSFIDRLSAAQIAELFVIAINQNDAQLLQAAYSPQDGESGLPPEWKSIKSIHRNDPLPEEDDTASLLKVEYTMNATVYRSNQKRERQQVTFSLERSAPGGRWIIRGIRLS
jgi:hypothetical protein